MIYVELIKTLVSVLVGFRFYIRVRGVGYAIRAMDDNELNINVGLTHIIKYKLHDSIKYRITRKAKLIRLHTEFLNTLRATIFNIRAFRKPDVYKGKGIRIRRDPVKKKQGKKRKTF